MSNAAIAKSSIAAKYLSTASLSLLVMSSVWAIFNVVIVLGLRSSLDELVSRLLICGIFVLASIALSLIALYMRKG